MPQLLIRKPLSFVAHYAHPRYHLVIWWPTSITSENVIIIRLNYNQGSALWCYSIVGTNIQVKLHELCFFPFLWNNLISRSLIIKKFASKTEFRAIFFFTYVLYYLLLQLGKIKGHAESNEASIGSFWRDFRYLDVLNWQSLIKSVRACQISWRSLAEDSKCLFCKLTESKVMAK